PVRQTGTIGPRTRRLSGPRRLMMSQQSCAGTNLRTWSLRRNPPMLPTRRFAPSSSSGRRRCGSSMTSSWPPYVTTDAISTRHRIRLACTEWARRNVLDIEIEPAEHELDANQNRKRGEHHGTRRCRNSCQCRVKPLADAEQRAAAHEREAEHELQRPGIEIAEEVRVKKSL